MGLFGGFRRTKGPLLAYRLVGGQPPPDDERLDVAPDGTFRLWRSMATASRPPTGVGRFAGVLAEDDLATLRSLAADCGRHGSVDLVPPAGASVETYRVAGVVASFAGDASPPGPWAAMSTLVRGLLVSLTSQASGAVALAQVPAGWALEGHGAEGVRVDLSQATVRVVRWDGDRPVEVLSTAVSGPREELAVAGWSFALPIPADATGSGYEVEVDDLLAHDGEFWHTTSLTATQP